MFSKTVSIDITAPPEKVYAYLSDFTNVKEWSMSVQNIQLVEGEAGKVGAVYRSDETIPQSFSSFATITALDAPRLIAWQSTDHQVFRTDWEIHLAPNSTGGTHLTQSVTFHPLSDFATGLLDTIRAPVVEQENLDSLGRVKKILEA